MCKPERDGSGVLAVQAVLAFAAAVAVVVFIAAHLAVLGLLAGLFLAGAAGLVVLFRWLGKRQTVFIADPFGGKRRRGPELKALAQARAQAAVQVTVTASPVINNFINVPAVACQHEAGERRLVPDRAGVGDGDRRPLRDGGVPAIEMQKTASLRDGSEAVPSVPADAVFSLATSRPDPRE